MNDGPLPTVLSVAIAGYLLYLWRCDFSSYLQGRPNARELPGARPAPLWLLWLSGLISVIIVFAETGLEYALGVSTEQSDVQWYYLFAMISAGVVEEVLFRGFFVIRKKGRAGLIGGVVAFSALFALLHMHLLSKGESGGYSLTLDPGPLLWTGVLFINSLWWYLVRLFPANRHQSLLPCFVGHICSNLAVFGIKLAQGHVLFG